MNTVTSRIAGAILAMVLALITGTGWAPAQADDCVIVIGGVQVLRIRAPYGGMSAKQRADQLRSRLVDIYAEVGHDKKPIQAGDVTLDLTPGRPAIRVRGVLLLSITQDDAKANGMALEVLARQWHTRLRDAILKGAPEPVDDQYPQAPEPPPQPAPSPSPAPNSQG